MRTAPAALAGRRAARTVAPTVVSGVQSPTHSAVGVAAIRRSRAASAVLAAGSRRAARAAWVSGTAQSGRPRGPGSAGASWPSTNGGAGGRGIRRGRSWRTPCGTLAATVTAAATSGGTAPPAPAGVRAVAAATRAPVSVLAAMVGTLGPSAARGEDLRTAVARSPTQRCASRSPQQRERTGEGRPVVPDRPSRAGWSRPLRRLSLAAGDPVRRTGHCTSPTQKAQSVTLGLLLVTERTVPTRSRCDQSFGQVGPGRGGGHVHQGQAPRFLNYGKCAYRHAL